MRYQSKIFIYSVILVISVWSCATPTGPTGGPADKTGPKIIGTYPESGTTNFHDDHIEFYFSKFVGRSTFRQALRIEPDIGLQYKIDWGRKRVAIKFGSSLPDSTTIIFTIGTDFADYSGNKIDKPFTLALSTGSRINKGKLKGNVYDVLTGKGTSGDKVLLYRVPVDLTKPAQYIGETDTSGTVTFTYLMKGKYEAFYLDDKNRDNIWEPKLEHAQPFSKQFVTLSTDSLQDLGSLYKVSIDTARPSLLGIGVLSSNRLRLRFSKNVQLNDSVRIQVTDTLEHPYSKAVPLFLEPGSPYVLYAYSNKALNKNDYYKLDIENLTDTHGNLLQEQDKTFQGSDQKDTTAVKIVGVETGKGIYPDQPVIVRYNAMLEGEPVVDSLKVIENNKMSKNWKKVSVQNNMLYVYPDSLWQGGVNFQIRLYNPALQNYSKYDPKIWDTNSLGSLSIVMADSADTTHSVHLEAINDEYNFRKDTTFTGNAVINNLPPINYTILIYEDLNSNGKWDYGSVKPYIKPEPYFIQKEVPVKSKLTAELKVDF